MRGRLASAGFRCSQNRGSQAYYDISVPLTFPCCYDVVGNEYSAPNQDILRLGSGPWAVELDLMQPLDPERAPRVHALPCLTSQGEGVARSRSA